MISLASNFLVPTVAPGLLAIVLFGTAFWLWMLVDALARPRSSWQAAEQSQALWVVVLILTSWIGAVLYLLIARPRLRSAAGIGR